MHNTIRTEQAASYEADTHPPVPTSQGDNVIQHALTILRSRLTNPGEALTSPDLVRDYLILQLAQLKEEHFALIMLDNQHRVIGFEVVARGTLDSASVYPREVVKMALRYNAAALIMAHNHPSGNPEPSSADTHITRRLKEALALIDVRVLDHIIIGGCNLTLTTSFAARGLI